MSSTDADTLLLILPDGLYILLSGTMGNLLALAAHCKRGDEIILGQRNHVFLYEGKPCPSSHSRS
jgi:hypothetical protein